MALATFAPLRRLLPTLLARPIHVSAPLSGGAGMSVGSHIVPTEEVSKLGPPGRHCATTRSRSCWQLPPPAGLS